VKRLLLLVCATLVFALLPTAGAAAADFTITPSMVQLDGRIVVKSGNTITFEAAPGDPGDSWDLNGDGVSGDMVGSPVQWVYSGPGPVAVTLNAPDGPVQKVIQVEGPSAEFVSFPAAPVAGESVTFAYSGGVDAIEWDLNGDHTFGDANGPVATTSFATPGIYAVSLRVTDVESPPARSTSTHLIRVGAAPATKLGGPSAPRLMSPFPVVRITGKVSKKGARIKRLTIRAPFGATINIRCRGKGCPFRKTSRTLALAGKVKSPSTTIRIKRLEGRFLRGGASIKVLVSRHGEVGKYTKFRIRKGKPPVRTDLCVAPTSTEPNECPAS
jgi:hypothetical protein